MEIIDELLTVLVLTMIGICIIFGIFCYRHSKEHKNELHNTGSSRPKHDHI